MSGEQLSREELFKGNYPGAKSTGVNCPGGNFIGVIVRGQLSRGNCSGVIVHGQKVLGVIVQRII